MKLGITQLLASLFGSPLHRILVIVIRRRYNAVHGRPDRRSAGKPVQDRREAVTVSGDDDRTRLCLETLASARG